MVKRILVFLFISFFFTSFASAQLRYALIPDSPRPGEPITIGIASNNSAKDVLLFVDGRQVAKSAFFSIPAEDEKPGFKAAVITIPSTAAVGNAVLRLDSERGVLHEISITIAPRDFVSEVIQLNERLTGIRTDPSPQRTEESNLMWSILTTTGNQVYHTGPFLPPVVSTRRTSFFGDRRVFEYSTGSRDTSIHAGVDYGVPTGTRVDACGNGRVVLARSRIVTGNTVVLEHAPGIYSLYYHLDSISVREGAMVTTGTLLGLSGSTGLSTAPHLHWEVRVSTENTDPDAFVNRQIIDKNLIISRIYN